MGSEPDDNAGPPPDPTERTWRHPSEIAAANAFAAEEAERERRRLSAWTLAMGGATGIALCIGVLVVASTVGGGSGVSSAQLATVTGSSASSSPSTLATAAPSTMRDAALRTSSTSGTPSSTVSAMSPASSPTLPTDLRSFDATGIHLVLDGETPIANAVDGAVLGDGALAAIDPASLVVPTSVATTLEGTDGTSTGESTTSTTAPPVEPVVEHLMLTSAAATAEADDLRVLIEGRSRAAVVIAADRYTDVAVVGVWRLQDPAGDASSADTTTTAPSAGTTALSTDTIAQSTDTVADPEVQEVVAETDDRSVGTAGVGDLVLIAGHDAPRAEHLGRLVATGQGSVAIDGHPLIDTLMTSARLPVAGAGSALCDAEGRIIGLVVHGDSKLAVAVPIERAAATAVALLEHGWAGGGHMGIEGVVTDGGIELTAVTDGGPAAAAGFEVGDVVVDVEGVAVDDFAALITVLRDAEAGAAIGVTVERDGEALALEVTLGTDA